MRAAWVLGFGAASVNLVRRRGPFQGRIVIEVIRYVTNRRDRQERLVLSRRRPGSSSEGPLYSVRLRNVGTFWFLHNACGDDALSATRRVRLVQNPSHKSLVKLPAVRLC